MFSLIITIISIALVAALALATIYYGGDAYTRGQAEANATRILNQGQQILGAAELFRLQNGTWPTVERLVADDFLKSAPVSMTTTTAAYAQSAAGGWETPVDGQPVYVLRDIDVATCQAVNESSYGAAGVLAQARTTYAAQCYGTPRTETVAADFKVVVTKNAAALQAVAADTSQSTITASQVSTAAAPLASDTTAWAVEPRDTTVASGGTDGTGGGTGPTTFGLSNPNGAYYPASEFEGNRFFVQTGADEVLTLTNTGTGVLTVSTVNFTDNSSGNILVETNSCTGATLSAGQTCSVQVDPQDFACGPESGNPLTFSTSEGGISVDVILQNIC